MNFKEFLNENNEIISGNLIVDYFNKNKTFKGLEKYNIITGNFDFDKPQYF